MIISYTYVYITRRHTRTRGEKEKREKKGLNKNNYFSSGVPVLIFFGSLYPRRPRRRTWAQAQEGVAPLPAAPAAAGSLAKTPRPAGRGELPRTARCAVAPRAARWKEKKHMFT